MISLQIGDIAPALSVSRRAPPMGPRLGVGNSKQAVVLDGWDKAVLGGYPLPGKAKIIRGSCRLKEDPKKKAGVDGANPTFHGLDPQAIDLRVTIWTDEQYLQLQRVCRAVAPMPGVTPTPVVFDHPSFYHLPFVINVQIIGVGAVIPHDDNRFASCEFYMRHWMRPPATSRKKRAPATATPTRAITNGITEERESRQPPNPPPMSQPDAGAPPLNYTPANP